MSRRWTAFLVLPAMLLAAPPAAAEDWRLTHRSPDEPPFGTALAFVDVDSVRRTGDSIHFFYRIAFREDGEIRGARVDAEANCASWRYRMLRQGEYRGDMLLREWDLDDDWLTADDGSNVQIVIEAACLGRYLTGKIAVAAYAEAELGR